MGEKQTEIEQLEIEGDTISESNNSGIVNQEKNDKENNLNNKKKKSHKKKILIICLSAFIILVVGIICIYFFIFRENSENKKEVASIELSKKEQKRLINEYGTNLEVVIAMEYTKSKTILDYKDATKLAHKNKNVKCKVHEIYDDGKVYLDKCSIDGKNTIYKYGKKQEKKDETATRDTVITIYELNNGSKTITKPINNEEYKVYTLDVGSTYDNVYLFKNFDFVVYEDVKMNGHVKNYKTGEDILSGLGYTSAIPILENNDYSTLMAFEVGGKWGIYNIITGKNIVPCIYDSLDANLTIGVWGPTTVITPLIGNNIAVVKDQKIGIINYTNNSVVIPFEYNYVRKVGTYLMCGYANQDKQRIFDFYGKEKLANVSDKYGMTNTNNYVYAVVDGNMKLLSIDGGVVYDFGKAPSTIKVNHYYENFIQFIKDNGSDKCIEYSYDSNTKNGKVLDAVTCGGIAKPILYLYPKKKTKVKVKLENPEILETTYPKYNNGWTVIAHKNGDLYDKDNKYYYGLYWDEKRVHTVDFSEGFYVESDNAIDFLEKKLDLIGLNKKEKNEFIMYWLPHLEKNGKSLVYFELTDEREKYNKINIYPKPDSLLRIVIHIKKIDEKTSIKEEKLTKFKRIGFSAIEWGGMTY